MLWIPDSTYHIPLLSRSSASQKNTKVPIRNPHQGQHELLIEGENFTIMRDFDLFNLNILFMKLLPQVGDYRVHFITKPHRLIGSHIGSESALGHDSWYSSCCFLNYLQSFPILMLLACWNSRLKAAPPCFPWSLLHQPTLHVIRKELSALEKQSVKSFERVLQVASAWVTGNVKNSLFSTH